MVGQSRGARKRLEILLERIELELTQVWHLYWWFRRVWAQKPISDEGTEETKDTESTYVSEPALKKPDMS